MKPTSPHMPLLCLGLIALAGCGKSEAPPKPSPPDVTVFTLHPTDAPVIQHLQGRLSAYRTADVRARIAGVLLKRTYKEGTDVKEGQLLYQIDPAPYRATLNTDLGQLAEAKASYFNYHSIAERYRQLIGRHYISQQDLDTAEANERNAAASVTAAQATVDNARIQLGWTSVRAPIAGRAEQQQYTEGAMVGASGSDSGTSGTLLTTVDQVDPLYVNFNIAVSDLNRLQMEAAKGGASLSSQQAQIHLTLPDGTPIPQVATMDFSSVLTDSTTGAVSLRATLPNPDRLFYPGQYVQLAAGLGTLHSVFVVPGAALQRDTQSAYVLTVDKDNKVVRKNVTGESLTDKGWIVTSGLQDGDRVVTDGIQLATNGATVSPHEAAPAASSSAPAAASSAKQS
ncbi:efflux RND transporter periplasmic adaptor subunit [Frateuria aurantia]